MVEDVLMKTVEIGDFEDVELDGKKYDITNLIRCIIDWPCELKYDEGLKIEGGDWEDWQWFRKEILAPNQDQIINLFKAADHSDELRKHFQRKEIFGED